MTDRCEMTIDINWSGGHPTLEKCGNSATLREELLMPYGAYACDECYQKLKRDE